jgi:hypothetical protein
MNKEEFNRLSIQEQVQEVNATGGPAQAGKIIGIAASTIKGRFSSNGYIRDEETGFYNLNNSFRIQKEDKGIKELLQEDKRIKELPKELIGTSDGQKEYKRINNNTKELKGSKNNLEEAIRSLSINSIDKATMKISFKINTDLAAELELFFQKNYFYKKQDIFNAAIKEFIEKYK